MAKNLGQFITYVIQDFKRDDKDTEIVQAYNDTINHIASIHPNDNMRYQSYIPSVYLQEDYPLPSNLGHLFHPVRCLEGSDSNDTGWPMEKLSKEAYDRRNPNPNRTTPDNPRRPVEYCIYSRSLLVNPPDNDEDYLFEINWAKIATEGSADSDIHELGNYWDEVIKWGILFRLYMGLGQSGEAADYKALYEDQSLGYPAQIKRDRAVYEKMGQVQFNDL